MALISMKFVSANSALQILQHACYYGVIGREDPFQRSVWKEISLEQAHSVAHPEYTAEDRDEHLGTQFMLLSDGGHLKGHYHQRQKKHVPQVHFEGDMFA